MCGKELVTGGFDSHTLPPAQTSTKQESKFAAILYVSFSVKSLSLANQYASLGVESELTHWHADYGKMVVQPGA